MLFVDWAIRHGLTERRRVGILGVSYGGFMVHWVLGHYPGRFAAGVSENPQPARRRVGAAPLVHDAQMPVDRPF